MTVYMHLTCKANDPLFEGWFELLKYYISDNDTMVVGKIWVAGKQHLGLGAQEGLGGEYRSAWDKCSRPASRGEAHIPRSRRGLWNQERDPLGGV